jgi:ADP-heptose:LPS heptosyltransferase
MPCVIDALATPQPLDEFAAALGATDLLLTVDTMAAHCAGAMAHPVWVALPSDPHWLWGLRRETSPWCPGARLFRQRSPGGWDDVVLRWCGALREWLRRT